jgi:NAD(P)-dependent dehydrogenase (short-subunit alcohol dehydrogenase family)
VTGGGRGIGAATARLAAARGYVVAVNFVTDSRSAQEVVGDIRALGGNAIAIQADASSESDVRQLFSEIDERFGALHALVNAVGSVPPPATIENISAARLSRLFAVNVTSAFICAREAVRRMSTRNGGLGGAIVNISSSAARLGSSTEYLDYAASKSAVDRLTVGLAADVASEGIRVNAVRPGVIGDGAIEELRRADEIGVSIPMNRTGRLEEIAQAILWLLSDDASFTTGTLLDVSGGL